MLENFNPDAMSEEELKEVGEAFRILAHYCKIKASAIKYRRKGTINLAQNYELACDKLYNKLLPKYRW